MRLGRQRRLLGNRKQGSNEALSAGTWTGARFYLGQELRERAEEAGAVGDLGRKDFGDGLAHVG